jgi:hypothetical protein
MFQIEFKTYLDDKWVELAKIDHLPLTKVLELVDKAKQKHCKIFGDIGEYRVIRIKK